MLMELNYVVYDTADPQVEDLIGKPVMTGMRLLDLEQNIEKKDESFVDILQGVDTTHNYFMLKSGRLCNLIYPWEKTTKENLYRPFESAEELCAKWGRFVSSSRPEGTMPLIWVKYKDTENSYLITGFTSNGIIAGEDFFTWEEAFENLSFLDNATFGEINV